MLIILMIPVLLSTLMNINICGEPGSIIHSYVCFQKVINPMILSADYYMPYLLLLNLFAHGIK